LRSIAIVGSGQVGLLAAHALLKAGYKVTVYSDRTPEQWLNASKPTGSAMRFDLSLQLEFGIGDLPSWRDKAPLGQGLHMTLCRGAGNRMLTLTGRTLKPFMAVDLRMQAYHWMQELSRRGGRLVIEDVSVARLDEIAAENDLTVVAAGKAELGRVFERDAERSVYDKPQRNLAMLCVKKAPLGFEGIPLLPLRLHTLINLGETFWIPYYHKDAGPGWNLVFESKPGGPMDRFKEATSGDQALEIGKKLVREFLPWDYEWIKNAELADPHGWLVGKFPPTVRKPVGVLPSGRLVTPLGDTAMALDPIGGQGANNGNKMARNLVESIIAREDRPFDAQWMTETFETFWVRHGHPTYTFNNMLLEPPTAGMVELFLAQYGSDGRPDNDSTQQVLANAFIENANDPALLTYILQDRRRTQEYLKKVTGRSWVRSVAGGALGVIREEFRQWRGLEPRHPLVPVQKVAA